MSLEDTEILLNWCRDHFTRTQTGRNTADDGHQRPKTSTERAS